MRKLFLLFIITCGILIDLNAQTFEYKVITTVESIVPMGIGRSRIIEENLLLTLKILQLKELMVKRAIKKM